MKSPMQHQNGASLPPYPPGERARVQAAQALIDLARSAEDLADAVLSGQAMSLGEFPHRTRGLTLQVRACITRAVHADQSLFGADWPDTADGLGISEELARDRYQDRHERWLRGEQVGDLPELPDTVRLPAVTTWPTSWYQLLKALRRWHVAYRARA